MSVRLYANAITIDGNAHTTRECVLRVVLMSDKQEVIVKSGTSLKDKVVVAAPDLEGQCAYE